MWSVDACRMGTPFSYATGEGCTMVPKTVILPCATCTNAWLDLHNSVQTKPPSLHLHCCTPLCQSCIVLLAAGRYNEADNSLLLFNYQVSSTICCAEHRSATS